MSFDYAGIGGTAARLLQRFGRATTIKRYGAAVYDVETSEAAVPETIDSCVAAVFPYDERRIDGTLILATDQQAFVSVVGLAEPKPGDVLGWSGQGLTVVRTKNLAPAGVFVLYELQVRL